jgi:LysR family transcriptional regulator, flagellar master operon regulator
MPQISHLRAFLEAANCGSFIEASARLNLSQSAVSARIRALESVLGERLFKRSKHGVVLNKFGEEFQPFAETSVRAWDQGHAAIKLRAQGGISVVAGIQQDLWDVFASHWFGQLKAELPDVELRLTCDYSDALCEQVTKGLLDIAIVFQPRRQRGFSLEHLAKLAVVMVSDRPFKWNGHLPPDYYYVDWGEAFTLWHDQQFGSSDRSALRVNVSGIARSAIRGNGGVTFLLQAYASRYFETGELYPVENAPRFAIDVFIASPGNEPRGKRVRPISRAIRVVAASLE